METARKDEGWLELYRETVLEHDSELLMHRVVLAQKAIHERMRDLWYQKSPEVAERERLTAAAHYLQILRSLTEKKQRAA